MTFVASPISDIQSHASLLGYAISDNSCVSKQLSDAVARGTQGAYLTADTHLFARGIVVCGVLTDLSTFDGRSTSTKSTRARPLRGVVRLMSRYGQIVGDRGRLPEFVSVECRKSSELTKTEAHCHLCNRRSIAPRQKDAPDFYQSEFSQIVGWSGAMHHLEGPRNGTRVSFGEAAKIIDTHDVAVVGACNSHEMFDNLRIPIYGAWTCFFHARGTKLLQIDPAVATRSVP